MYLSKDSNRKSSKQLYLKYKKKYLNLKYIMEGGSSKDLESLLSGRSKDDISKKGNIFAELKQKGKTILKKNKKNRDIYAETTETPAETPTETPAETVSPEGKTYFLIKVSGQKILD